MRPERNYYYSLSINHKTITKMYYCKTAEIKRLNEEDSSGYQTAIITLFDEAKQPFFSRRIDSFQILDKVCFDFEGDGDIKLWPYDDSANAFLDVEDTYGPRIRVVKV